MARIAGCPHCGETNPAYFDRCQWCCKPIVPTQVPLSRISKVDLSYLGTYLDTFILGLSVLGISLIMIGTAGLLTGRPPGTDETGQPLKPNTRYIKETYRNGIKTAAEPFTTGSFDDYRLESGLIVVGGISLLGLGIVVQKKSRR